MRAFSHPVRVKRRVAIEAIMAMVIIVLMIQMWLLTATLESFLVGHSDAALPGALISGVLFLGCAGLYRMIVRLDRAPEREEEPHGLGPWSIR